MTAKPRNPASGGAQSNPGSWPDRIFETLAGCFLGLTLLKLGDPIIFEDMLETPSDVFQVVLAGWPMSWGYWMLAIVAMFGVAAVFLKQNGSARNPLGKPLLAAAMLPAIWLGWQWLAGARTSDAAMTGPTVNHFTACVVCFYLGFFVLSRNRNPRSFWIGLTAGFALALVSGLYQHFGGLVETRNYFFLYIYPDPTFHRTHPGPLLNQYIEKMKSNRIYGPLMYPNAFAGVILLLLPTSLAAVASLRDWFTAGARTFLALALALAAFACLYWSGSKGGWLLMLVEGFAAVLCMSFSRKRKLLLIAVVLVAGLTGFFVKNAAYFRRGATSVTARFDYWSAVAQTARAHPLFGTGPGTFGEAYDRIRPSGAEMAMLAHNDYFQQASDSGVPGFLAYGAMIALALGLTGRHGSFASNPLKTAVWIGVLGWALQSFVEFGLYIPALAWTAFFLMGWLLGLARNGIDRTLPPA